MIDCVQGIIRACVQDYGVAESNIALIAKNSFSLDVHCSDGSLNLTTMLPDAEERMPCGQRFFNESRPCVKTYHDVVVLNKADPRLCRSGNIYDI